ncbi:MAG: LysR family transcriptional regulator [Gammaproteobacteria bacterium]|jgi:DNA-binding transcriptional LysR family regulator|nr:LysR family transcriptional regulator [Gammaproteobacteria bacterium]
MKQYNLADLLAFTKVVESGGFRNAAELLDTSSASISRRVSSLEDALGVKLLNRTTRRLHLTDAGEEYYAEVQRILAALDEAESKVLQNKQQVSGNLRLAAPLSYGITRIAPLLPAFLKQHPKLNIHLQLEDRETDLFAEGIDVAIRIGKLRDSSLIATRIGEISRVFCASPDYLSKYGEPKHPNELQNHRVLRYNLVSAREEWGLGSQPDSLALSMQGQLSANNGEALREAAIQGLGITSLPTFIVEDALHKRQLVKVMCEHATQAIGLYAIRLSRQFIPMKINLLIEFLKQQLSETPRD